jgi:hypothetical protein
MKKLTAGLLLGFALLFAQAASASPCSICQPYYPCSWTCENCVRSIEGPGMWIEDGYCWGEMQESTCGESGICAHQSSASPSFFENADQSITAMGCAALSIP